MEGTLGRFIFVAKSVSIPVSRVLSFDFLLLERKRSERFSDAAGLSDDTAGDSSDADLLVGSVGAAIDLETSLDELDALEDEFLRSCLWPDNRCCTGVPAAKVGPTEEHLRQVQVLRRASSFEPRDSMLRVVDKPSVGARGCDADAAAQELIDTQ